MGYDVVAVVVASVPLTIIRRLNFFFLYAFQTMSLISDSRQGISFHLLSRHSTTRFPIFCVTVFGK